LTRVLSARIMTGACTLQPSFQLRTQAPAKPGSIRNCGNCPLRKKQFPQ
jgi:hypothetical protein